MQLFEYQQLPYPVNLWSAVFQREIDPKSLPEDWEDSLNYVFNAIGSEHKKTLLTLYFKEKLSMKEICHIHKTRRGAVRQRLVGVIGYMQRSDLLCVLQFGLKKTQAVREGIPGSKSLLFMSPEHHDPLAQPISFLGLHGRVYNALRRAGIDTVGELVSHSGDDLTMFKGLGERGADEIERCLAFFGLTLKEQAGGTNTI